MSGSSPHSDSADWEIKSQRLFIDSSFDMRSVTGNDQGRIWGKVGRSQRGIINVDRSGLSLTDPEILLFAGLTATWSGCAPPTAPHLKMRNRYVTERPGCPAASGRKALASKRLRSASCGYLQRTDWCKASNAARSVRASIRSRRSSGVPALMLASKLRDTAVRFRVSRR